MEKDLRAVMPEEKKKKSLFALIILAALCICLVFACIGFVDINSYENRTANKIEISGAASYLSGEFQEKTEAGLSDQLPFAIFAKKKFNDIKSFLTAKGLDAAAKLFGGNDKNEIETSEKRGIDFEKYFDRKIECMGDESLLEINNPSNYGDNRYYLLSDKVNNFNGQLLIRPEVLPDDPASSGLLPVINRLSENAKLNIYAFYIERETDIDFATGEKVGFFDALKQNLKLDDKHIGCFEINNFEDYNELFYATDHHWNNKGSYLGYRMVSDMLKPGSDFLYPKSEQLIGRGYGSRAIGSAQGTNEAFYAYDFGFNESDFEIKANGEKLSGYGSAEKMIAAAKNGEYENDLYYAMIYGEDVGELRLRLKTGKNSGKILVIGDSFDNAILKPLAANYDTLFSVDIRYYKEACGSDFYLEEYVQRNDIDTVLFIGRESFFFGDEFIF